MHTEHTDAWPHVRPTPTRPHKTKPHQFTVRDIEEVRRIAKALAHPVAPENLLPKHVQTFFQTVASHDHEIFIDTWQHENDTLYVGGCAITATTEEVGGLDPYLIRKMFVVEVPGDDGDTKEIASVYSLTNAVCELYMELCEEHFCSIVDYLDSEGDQS